MCWNCCSLRDRAQLTVVSGEDGFLARRSPGAGLGDGSCFQTWWLPSIRAVTCGAVLALTRLFRQRQPDLVHLHSSKAGLLGRVAAKLSGVPAVFTAHGWAFTEGASAARRQLAVWAERLAAPLSAPLSPSRQYDRALAARLHVTRKAVAIHNALPEVAVPVRRSQHRTSRRVRLVMVARFSAQKDQLLLLRAAAAFPADGGVVDRRR